MTARRRVAATILRLVLFAAIAAGAGAFVLRTRGQELGPTPQAASHAQSAGPSAYYINFRLARARSEAAEESVLRTILADSRAPAAARAKAEAELAAVAQAAREETEIESVLSGQGFRRSAVVISGTSAMVVVPARAMSLRAAARIGTDLWNLAGVEPQNVLIRPRA